MPVLEVPKLICPRWEVGARWAVAKVELPESWAGVAQPLCALMAEFDRAGVVAKFVDTARNVVDRLAVDTMPVPPLRPDDRRMSGTGGGVLAHASWHVEVGEIKVER
jgi:hypothetical protein